MIELDEDQDRTLRQAFDRRDLPKMRRAARFGLTVWSVLRPRHFRKWNEARMARQRSTATCQPPEAR
jgi:hypothetical protein